MSEEMETTTTVPTGREPRLAGTEQVKRSPLWTRRTISHDEAREVSQRLINSHFHQVPCARVGIPARPDYDDDLLISAYIEQQRDAQEAMRRALQITSGWLALLAKEFDIDEADTQATLRVDGEVIAETSLGEALEIANKALEPESRTP